MPGSVSLREPGKKPAWWDAQDCMDCILRHFWFRKSRQAAMPASDMKYLSLGVFFFLPFEYFLLCVEKNEFCKNIQWNVVKDTINYP